MRPAAAPQTALTEMSPLSMSEGRFHKKHQKISQTLLQTISDALEETFGAKEAISREELRSALSKLELYWPNVEPLFERTCKECKQSRTYVRDARRTDLLTRLVFSRILTVIPARPLSAPGMVYPKILAPSLQKNLTAMFVPSEWEMLNDQAKKIFELIGSDDDQRVWRTVSKDETISLLVDKVFISILLRFRQFNLRVREFFRITNYSMDENVYRFTNRDFCEIFEGLFMPLNEAMSTEEGRLRIRLSHGEETLEKLQGIFSAYARYKQSVPATRKVA